MDALQELLEDETLSAQEKQMVRDLVWLVPFEDIEDRIAEIRRAVMDAPRRTKRQGYIAGAAVDDYVESFREDGCPVRHHSATR